MTSFSVSIGTRTGDNHQARGIPNQDYACYAILPNDMGVIAAVSDGAGSAPLAQTGSTTAARGAAERAWKTALRLGHCPDPIICVQEGFRAARKALEAKSRLQGRPLDDYHATLIVGAITRSRAAVAHIGDGASIVRTAGVHKMLTIPARGQYANETFFITMDEPEDLIARNSAEKPSELLMFTDGVQNELIDFREKRANKAAAESLRDIGQPPDKTPTKSTGKQTRKPSIITRTDPSLSQWLEAGQTTHSDDATILIIRTEHPLSST